MQRKKRTNSRSGTSMRGGKSAAKTTKRAESAPAPKQFARFDFPAGSAMDFKAMAEAFQEFAKKAMAGKLDKPQG
jgi:hypothetical protein